VFSVKGFELILGYPNFIDQPFLLAF